MHHQVATAPDGDANRPAKSRPGFPLGRAPTLLASALVITRLGLAANPNNLPAEARAAGEVTFRAGDLQLALSHTTNGIGLRGIRDMAGGFDLLASSPPPLFGLVLRHTQSTQEVRLTADAGWRATSVRKTLNGFELQWRQPVAESLRGVAVTATAACHEGTQAWHWRLRVKNDNPDWSVWRVVFPQVAVTDLGEEGAVLFPRGPGEVQRNVWNRAFTYHGNYPSGWCCMQFMAAYREPSAGRGASPPGTIRRPEAAGTSQGTGLYLAVHDPWGSTKDLAVESDPAKRRVVMSFEHPAPDMGKAGRDFELSGEAVWQLLRGDWFDAAVIYKAWARREAHWWPRVGKDGRGDTPEWMRTLDAWAMTGGAPGECVARVEAFQQFLGLPLGFHWYNWHQIPFDNDYPHYFPAKEGFTQGVAELQRSNVYVMPYINGRLWDSLDRGAEDFEFSRRARVATTKDAQGQPYLESYGSKETNGQPVRLAVMCPSTTLWQKTVHDIVIKLTKEAGTRAVYIDQVAAAPPKLCLDASHGHPLGGGHWWNLGYWNMLHSIRSDLPPRAMLTTECNGEPFVRWFDGYLTWHWQHDGQVAAFPAVYGGMLQMFGRAYRAGATKDLALRMKAGQQLVFGEQLGWIDPGVVQEKENAEFFRQCTHLRARLNRYFSAGEMARPPRLNGSIPQVRADWQWSGEWWVTTDAVLTGAWRRPAERRLVLLFVNVSDQPVQATVAFDPGAYHVVGKTLSSQVLEVRDGAVTDAGSLARWDQPTTFPARTAQAWEFGW